jgi:hypothetical protein
MSATDFDRFLADWLADGPTAPPSEVLERAFAEARTVPQARAFRLPWAGLPPLTMPRPFAVSATAVLAMAVLVVAVVGTLYFSRLPPAPAASPSANPTAPIPDASPSQTPAHESQTPALSTAPPAATSTPAPSPSAAVFGWQPIGTIDGPVAQAVSFDGGYVAWGLASDADDNELAWAWFSADGQAWQGTQIGGLVRPCPGVSERPEWRPINVASDGSSVVLVGRGYRTDIEPCGDSGAVAWVTDDGRSWQRSASFGASASSQATAVWAVPGGWEAVVGGASGEETSLWRSPDGLSWEKASVLTETGSDRRASVGAATPTGERRLIAVQDVSGGPAAIIASTDGLTWQDVLSLPAHEEGTITEILPPSSPAGPWVVVYDTWPVVTVWTSADLEEWAQVEFPTPYLDALGATRFGFIAAGADDCFYTGGECPPDDLLYETFTYQSDDGVDWAEIEPIGNRSLRPETIIDGPGGTLAIGGQGGPTSEVWRLVGDEG